jgi:hypothetical protein
LLTQVNTATQTATASGLHFTAYAVVLQSSGYVLPQRAIVVDDMSAGFAKHGTPEHWHIAPPPDGVYYAGQAHWTYSSVFAQDNWATWTPPTPLDGNYLVIAFIPSQRTSTQHAQYQVHHNSKIDTVEISQTLYLGDWAILGLFDFSGSTQSYVSLSDVTGEDGWYIAFDAIAFISANVGPPSGGIVVDDASSGFAPQGPVGYWSFGPPPPAIYYAGQSHWTLNNFSVQQNWAAWTPASPLEGNYQVWAFVPSFHSDTRSARYRVYHNGQVDNVEINQSRYLGEWVSLGVFDFTAATAGYVWLSDVTGKMAGSRHVAFDAVAFAPNNLFLPLVLKNHPPPQPMKQRTGIHLGSREDAWPESTLQKISGNLPGGVWPRAVVVQSSQLYILDRRPPEQDPLCPIAQARVRLDGLYNYLTEAQRNSVTIIIRITPSPGNFQDWENAALPHVLRADITPAGGNYCDGKFGKFRAIDDIATEMHEIYKLNVNQHSWNPAQFFFEPANEPNKEWYWDWKHDEEAQTKLQTQNAWTEMDAYFSALFDHAKSLDSNIRVLTPSMAQGNFAETKRFVSCASMTVTVTGQSGYDFMQTTFTTQNDGYSWHNYWRKNKEYWKLLGGPCPDSEHVFQYFPNWLKTVITTSNKPTFVTEADLFSPCQENDNPIKDKDSQAAETQQSLWWFVSEEQETDYIIAWLLTEYPYSMVATCPADDQLINYEEIKWHQAYENSIERAWFSPWWSIAK